MYKELSGFTVPSPTYTIKGWYGNNQQRRLGQYACLYSHRNSFDKENITHHYLTIEKEGYSIYKEEDVLEYLRFLNNAGYPIVLENTAESYTFVFEHDVFQKWHFFLAAFTAIRYMFNHWQLAMVGIPYEAINLKNQFDDSIDELEALQLAHYKGFKPLSVYNRRIDSLHNLFSHPSTLVDKEEYVRRMLKESDKYNVNSAFRNKEVKMSFEKLNELAQQDITQVLKILKPDGKEKMS